MATPATRIEEDLPMKEMTPHQLIMMLLDGALERVDNAISHIGEGEIDQAVNLVQKIIAIVNSLRDSLNLAEGGDIAGNLDALYEYIVMRLNAMGDEDPKSVLEEVRKLLVEVHSGWTAIPEQIKSND